MKFTIVTCTWNSEPYVSDCIESVLSQDYPHVEWIFVDGGSTDGTLERIQSLPRSHTLIENVRGGISNAMNAGLEAASGDVVLFLHSDDFLYGSNVLALTAELFKKYGCNWLFGRVLLSIDGKLVPEKYIPPSFTYSNLLKGNFIPHAATFVRRAYLLKAGGFDPGLKYAMDYDMWLKLAPLAGAPLQLGAPLAVFREHQGSLSTRERLPAMEEDFRVRLKYAGGNIVNRAMHYVRYFVRRRRITRGLAQIAA